MINQEKLQITPREINQITVIGFTQLNDLQIIPITAHIKNYCKRSRENLRP